MPQKTINKKSLPRIKQSEDVVEETADDSLSPVESSKDEKFSLYVRAAAWMKDRDNASNRLKEIEPSIVDVRHPRQKSADFCFIDFASALDRDNAYEKLKSHSEINVKPVTKDVPKMLNKRQKIITEKREAKKETRKLIAQIKKKEKLNAKLTETPNQIVIVNLPRQVTVAELKEQYTNAIKVIVKKNPKMKSVQTAIIAFPDPKSAFNASKESISLHGQKINVMLNKDALLKGKKKNKTDAKRKSATEPAVAPPKQKKSPTQAK